MNKFSNIIITESKSPDDQLKMGIEIESEHGDIYEYLEDFLNSKDLKMPLTKKDFYKKIAEAHLKEIPDYYTRLKKMESE
jgi:hypothetical protein